MTITEILKGTDKVIHANIDLLAADYLSKKGKILNKGCPACVKEMVLTLKHFYKMAQFKFKRNAASYKDKKGDKTTISNSTMTDEKALKFLKTNPERIELFSEYPSNWKELIEGKIETEEERKKRIAAEAELAAAEAELAAAEAELAAAEEGKKETEGGDKEEGEEDGSVDISASREELMKMGLKELRKAYPNIKATSTEDFVNKVLAE